MDVSYSTLCECPPRFTPSGSNGDSSLKSSRSHKDLCLTRYDGMGAETLLNRRLVVLKQLERSPRTYVVYTDLHGSYEKFLYWLKNGMGCYRIAVSSVLGPDYTTEVVSLYERLLLIVNRHRIARFEKLIRDGKFEAPSAHDYFMDKVAVDFVYTLDSLNEMHLTNGRIMEDLLRLLRAILRGDDHRLFKAVPQAFRENIMDLYFQKDTPSYQALLNAINHDSIVFHLFASFIVKLMIVHMFDKHVNLGDSFDRGEEADLLIEFYQSFFFVDGLSPPMHYIFGNHDILWMGASVGSPILCMTALRISLRYKNTAFLDRYGFDLTNLRRFAEKVYTLTPTGSYSSSKAPDEIKKMAKVLQILELKLTVLWIRRAHSIPGEIDYSWYEQHYFDLLKLLPIGVPEDASVWEEYQKQHPLYSDVFFPTIMEEEDPERLTEEEMELVHEIVRQFTTLPKFQRHMQWMFNVGEVYRVIDNTLYYHAALPATEEGGFEQIKGMEGKKLLDWIQRDLKKIGRNWSYGQEPTLRQKMLLWYMWTGRKSPFFCKSKMATVERAIFNEEPAAASPLTTWKEVGDVYYSLVRRDGVFLSKLLKEFHADKLVMGHTPVKSAEQGVLSREHMAFLIDGGASPAYGDRGAILISTPEYTYVTFQPPLEELKKAEEENRLPDIHIVELEETRKVKLGHMEKGYFLREELAAIDEVLPYKLKNLYESYFVPKDQL
eukprot:TRINITY_DN4380_c0_g1_i2.p1 TRINITY_DN4380_c0_g1~~TRINITY_DN4380_c0_g1_i2.p1  ORF type:complete len:718 (+),score=192.26 TRINITY_DN4380_c0_g1_i2:141-2294(+)